MTSITSNVTIPQASPTNNSSAQTSSSSHARTPSVSGQTSSSAAVQASAPAQRQLSYATAAKKLSAPVIAASPPHVPAGATAQNVRPSSTASPAVNGKIPPAVANSGPATANGASNPYTGGLHSRKSSVASGAGGSMMPNGAPRGAPSITFGAINEPTGPASGSAAAASTPSLTAPLASNQKASSPQSSPSPVVQPMATGGVPPGQATSANVRIQFGEATHHQQHQRPVSMPPVPSGPGSMNLHAHQRRESTHSAHAETGPHLGHGQRGAMRDSRGGGRHQGYQNNHQYNQQNQYNNGYGRGGYGGPNQNRGPPPNMNQQQGYGGPNPIQGYPNSPRNIHRSPAITHASPSLAAVTPMATPQLFPQQHYMPQPGNYGLQASMHYDPNQGYYQQPQPYLGYQQMGQMGGPMGGPYPLPQTSPRPQYQQMAPPVNGGYNIYTQPMSRQGSTNMAHNMEVPGRPTSSMGHMPTQPHTPQPISVPPVSQATPGGAGPSSPFTRPKTTSKAIPIVNPTTLANIKIEKPQTPVVVTSAPVIVSSPSPAPGRTVSRNTVHSRSASSSGKTEQERREELKKREEMKAAVAKSLEEDKLKEEEAKRKKEVEEREKERIEAEKKEAEEKARKEKEEEERKAKEAEELRLKEEAEEKARKEAEAEAARKAEEERIKREAEEAAEAARLAEEKAVEEARIAKEKEEEEARLEAERVQKLKEEEEAKAKAEAEAKAAEEAAQKAAAAAAAAVAAAAAAAAIPAAPSVARASTPDSESMPPPAAKGPEKRTKPNHLNLAIKTNEPGPPSAAFTALKSARFIENINSINYPTNILSPNPALNPAATGKFKYEKDFLLQFQTVFTEKPTADWDKTMKDTVGEPDSARPQTARTPGLGPRGSSRSGGASAPPPMGAFGSFKGPLPANMLTSDQRFQQSNRTASLPVNPLASLANSFSAARSGGVGIIRTNSSSSLASNNNALPSSPRTGSRSQRGGSRKGGGAPMEKSESRQGSQASQPLNLPEVKPLPVSENRWKPRTPGSARGPEAAPTPSEDVRLSPEMVQRKVKAALNKMTPEKFDKISDQILEITSQSKFETNGLTLRQVIQLTFEKATDEAAWSSMYARFCRRMLESMDPDIKDEGIRKNGQIVTGGNLFRMYLLNRCQEEFERGWKINLPPKPEGVSDEAVMLSDEYYIAAAAKRRGLGLIQFIGELFKLGMLTERIMNECIHKLLDFEGLPEDETVESLCKLLKTIGLQLDNSEKSHGMMDVYFHRISRMAEDKDLNSRMKFMLMDIIDLRRKKWETKEADKGPKTIQEVREDALKAQQEKEAASRANSNQRRPGGGGRGGGDRSFSQGGYGSQMHPSNWQDQSKGGTLNPDELRKLANKSRQTSAGLSGGFGPGGPGGMLGSRSSSNGSRRGFGPQRIDESNASSRAATPATKGSISHANAFSLLQESVSSYHDHGESNDATSPPASSPPTAAARLERSRSPLQIGDSK